jgi:electron transfer flavoprotein alpha subunit
VSAVITVVETRRGELRDVSLELVTAGRALAAHAGVDHAVAILARDPWAFVPALSVDGVDAIVLVATPTEHFEAHVAEQAVLALIEQERPQIVVAGNTIDSFGFAPAVAARAGLGFASDVTRLGWDDGPVAWRGAYGGKLEVELGFAGKACTLLLIRPGTHPAAAGSSSPAVRELELARAEPATEHVAFRDAQLDDVDITKASVLLSIGRGIEDQESIPRFEQLAEAMGATLSSSRPLVDAGWLPSSRQVGQSGRTVKPRVYLALGISGAVQHLAGIQSAETIIAVNRDPEAPIFGVADYGAVADLFDVAEQLERQFG